jgi:hypothetical protein
VNKDAVWIGVLSGVTDADVTIFIQRVSYHLFRENDPVPRKAKRMRFDRLARNRTAMLIVTASPGVP